MFIYSPVVVGLTVLFYRKESLQQYTQPFCRDFVSLVLFSQSNTKDATKKENQYDQSNDRWKQRVILHEILSQLTVSRTTSCTSSCCAGVFFLGGMMKPVEREALSAESSSETSSTCSSDMFTAIPILSEKPSVKSVGSAYSEGPDCSRDWIHRVCGTLQMLQFSDSSSRLSSSSDSS